MKKKYSKKEIRYVLNSWWFKKKFSDFLKNRKNKSFISRFNRLKDKKLDNFTRIHFLRGFVRIKRSFRYNMLSKYRHLQKSRYKFKLIKLGRWRRPHFFSIKVRRRINRSYRLAAYRNTKQLRSFFFSYMRSSRKRYFVPIYRRRRWHISKYVMRIIRARKIKNRHYFRRKYLSKFLLSRSWRFLRNARNFSFFSIFDKNDPDIQFIFSLLNSSIMMLHSIFLKFDTKMRNFNKLRFFLIRAFLLKFIFSFSYINKYKFVSFFYKIHKHRSKYKYKFSSIINLANNFFFFNDN